VAARRVGVAMGSTMRCGWYSTSGSADLNELLRITISSPYLDSSDHKEDHQLLFVGGGVLIWAADEVCNNGHQVSLQWVGCSGRGRRFSTLQCGLIIHAIPSQRGSAAESAGGAVGAQAQVL